MSHMYDSTQPNLIPTTAPYIAVYINGHEGVTDPAKYAKSRPHARIFWIDVLGSNPDASIKDVETGDIRPEHVPAVCTERHNKHPDALIRIYCNLSTWPDVKNIVRAELTQSIRNQIRYWIANPTGSPHIVPGSQATQYAWLAEYDLSSITPGFLK